MTRPADFLESGPPVLPSPGRGLAKRAGIAALLLGLVTTSVVAWRWLHFRGDPNQTAEPAPVVVASFRADFREGTPKEPWKYLWNAGGPLGDPGNYSELRWNGKVYAVDPAAYPAAPPARYLRVAQGSGHPGQGPSQGQEVDRCVIIAFTVPESGRHWLTNSAISRLIGPRSGCVVLRVFVSDREISAPVVCRSREGVAFDRALGLLAAGETIYVAVGPDETDMDDSFELDFAIAR